MKTKYLLQTCLIAALMISFYACENTSKEEEVQLKDIQLNLNDKLSFGHFFPQRELAFSDINEAVQLQNIPSEFVDYELKSFTFNIAQAYYQDFKNDKISAEEFQMLQQIYQIDTTQLSSTETPSKLYMAIGEIQNGNRAVVVDTDLDLDFKDEKLHEFEYPIRFVDEDDEEFYQRNKIEFLPKATVQYGDDETEQFILLIDPYEEDLANNTYSEKYFLSISIPKLKTQELQIKDQTFIIEAKSNFTQVQKQSEKLQFLVFQKKDSIEVGNEIDLLRFQLNDTINLSNNDFQLTYENGEFILKSLGYNNRPTGSSEGFFLPKIKTNYLDGTAYAVEEYEEQFQLFYFWTTWSLPSLEDVAQLKKIQKDQENVAVVGVAVDANQGAVKRMIVRQEMNWKTLYAPSETANNLKPALQLKVMSFPTYILVNEEGKIIKRTHHLKEVVEVFAVEE